MRITMDLFAVFCYLILIRLASAKPPVTKSKNSTTNAPFVKIAPFPGFDQMNMAAYPQPLPTIPAKHTVLSYTTLYQGLRYKDDTRVFRKRFEYEAMLKGQQISCKGIFDCVISHIAIESSEAIPVLLRGGAGYRHFTAVIKAKPHHALKGQVRVYCRNNYALKNKEPRRKFFFGNRLAEK